MNPLIALGVAIGVGNVVGVTTWVLLSRQAGRHDARRAKPPAVTYPPPLPDKTKMIPVSLQADGVLWAINRVVFHPRGFALAVDTDGSFALQGNGTEVWSFPAEIDDYRFAALERLLVKARISNA